jgi:hypothetical protein
VIGGRRKKEEEADYRRDAETQRVRRRKRGLMLQYMNPLTRVPNKTSRGGQCEET